MGDFRVHAGEPLPKRWQGENLGDGDVVVVDRGLELGKAGEPHRDRAIAVPDFLDRDEIDRRRAILPNAEPAHGEGANEGTRRPARERRGEVDGIEQVEAGGYTARVAIEPNGRPLVVVREEG